MWRDFMNEYPLPTKELQCYSNLQGRKKFSRSEQLTLQNLRKGYLGEKRFAQFIQQQLNNDYIALYDILLEDKGTLFQIDCLLIFSNQLFLIEIKYYQGEFELVEDGLYDYLQQKTYRNPLHQLKRSSLLLQDLLTKLRVNLSVQPQLVFNHHTFTLFQAKRQTSILLPTQLYSFTSHLNGITGNLQAYHYRLANKIKQLHISESPYERLPIYEYDHLQKGVFCPHCRKKMRLHYRELSCVYCSYSEVVDSGILRSTIEFSVLFPDEKIKRGIIVEWCGEIVSKNTIGRILKNYLKLHKNATGSNYTFH